MLGLILDYYWVDTTQDPVQISVEGSLTDLRNVKSVDPLQAVDGWPRADVVPIEQHDVSSQLGGGLLKGHICARRGTNFMASMTVRETDG